MLNKDVVFNVFIEIYFFVLIIFGIVFVIWIGLIDVSKKVSIDNNFVFNWLSW